VRALVVDDEGPARRRLARMLEALAGVTVVAELEDTAALLDALQRHTADVIFLDICMPGVDGMSFAQAHAGRLPELVFVTAHDRYAVSAFGVEALDYLLKPVRPERLAAAVERVRRRMADDASAAATPPEGGSAPLRGEGPRIVSGTRQLLELFDAREITRFWASDKYTLFRAGGAERLTEEPLTALEERLGRFGFVRVHRAELVRSDAVRALRLVDGHYELCLADGQCARVSRRALPAIRAALGLG
jgi:DNA-binding LytR/AlgR family response regulator